jgi:hypothetical protein
MLSLLITMHTVLVWWVVATWCIVAIFNFVSFYHLNEMIGEINGQLPEEEQVPFSIVEVIGKPNKFARLERGYFWNVLRLHGKLFPHSTRRKAFQLSSALVIVCFASGAALACFLAVSHR